VATQITDHPPQSIRDSLVVIASAQIWVILDPVDVVEIAGFKRNVGIYESRDPKGLP